MNHFILIDGSYFIFYRYFALIAWWKVAKKDDELGNPSENEEFVEKYRKTFISKMEEIPKKLGYKKKDKNQPIIMVGKDCSRNEIWRSKMLPSYKGTRDYSNFHGGPLFSMTYNDNLFQEGGAKAILSHPHLEADDCIAITARHICATQPKDNTLITIITSDTDYMQICSEQIKLITLKFKPVNNEKNSYGIPEKDLFCKIVIGDKSDNIPGVFKKCGKKTAEKYYDDRELFNKKLDEDESGETRRRYEHNRRMISFDEIPKEYVDEFRRDTLKIK